MYIHVKLGGSEGGYNHTWDLDINNYHSYNECWIELLIIRSHKIRGFKRHNKI